MDEQERQGWLKERERAWDDGFTFFTEDMLPPGDGELDCITDPEWIEVRRLLEAGFTVGIVAHAEEPVAFMAEIGNHMNGIPLRAYCDDDENMLYVRAKDADVRKTDAYLAREASKKRKPRKQIQRRAS